MAFPNIVYSTSGGGATPGGSSGQLQINQSGTLAGIGTFTGTLGAGTGTLDFSADASVLKIQDVQFDNGAQLQRVGGSLEVKAVAGAGIYIGDVANWGMFVSVGLNIAYAAIQFPTLSDVAAPANSLFLGSDHLDINGEPKLCRKGATVVTPIG